ncbi:MAG: response regulator [Promethearchaeota archaeon]
MSKNVLIVDDAEFMRNILKKILINNDFEIAGEAENGEIGITQYKTLKPDLVLMDLMMPVKSGLDSIKEIISFDKNAKIIVVSSLGQELLVLEAIEMGAKDFIVKPFKKEKLMTAIDKVLGK